MAIDRKIPTGPLGPGEQPHPRATGKAKGEGRRKGSRVTKDKFGTKLTCQSCGAKFYDMKKKDPACPKCETVYQPEKPKARRSTTAAPAEAQPKTAPAPDKESEDSDSDDIDLDIDDDLLDTDDDGEDDDSLMEDTSDIGGDEEDIGEVVGSVDSDGDDKDT